MAPRKSPEELAEENHAYRLDKTIATCLSTFKTTVADKSYAKKSVEKDVAQHNKIGWVLLTLIVGALITAFFQILRGGVS